MPTAPTPSMPAGRTARCWTLTAAEGSVDVEVTASDDDRLVDVVAGIARALRVAPERLWSASAPLPEDLRLAAPELAHGAVLGWGRSAVEPAAVRRSSALELHVTGGPEAGRALPLGRGRHLLGRGSDASIRLDDPDVSRCHVRVEVGAGGITATDLGSTNGSRLDGSPLAGAPRPWRVGSTLRLGASALTVRGPGEGPTAVDRCAGGRLAVRPIPRAAQPVPPVEIAFPRTPEARTPRRLAWIAVALPAVGGVLMAVVLHTPTFLFFALLSPLVALATWISERWSGRRTGRRERAEHAAGTRTAADRLDAAVAETARLAEENAPDLAALTTAARRRSRLLWSRPRDAANVLTVRIGTGPGATTVVRVDGDGGRSPARAGHLPVTVDLREDGLSVVGPRARALGVLAAALVQLTALSAPGEIELLLLLDAARIGNWTWTRWLPHLAPGAVAIRSGAHTAGPAADDESLAARLNAVIRQRSAAMAGEGAADGTPGWLVVVVDRPLDARVTELLGAARSARVVVVQSAETLEALPVVLGTVLRLGGETGDVAVLSSRTAPDRHEIAVDRVSAAVAAQFARDLAALAPAATSSALPAEVRLRDLPTEGLRFGPDGQLDGRWTTDRGRLLATIGRTADSTVEVDLCRDGPHALIAGTTGSGKSELLQSLITGLALNHPPDRCSFLLVDYKGGAAFADAAALPHTVGVVTDLDGQTTVRALRSLAAELTRRESILGAHRVTDIAALPADIPLARLVIVVDEFATLAEELPSFVPGLVSIAQRGRSLGVHLVLATQRPSGVVSPEIRANCTLRICLRTTDESDSRDVLGSPAAAFLPVAVPGRAYVRAGHASPSLLQVARVAVDGTPGATPAPEVRRWSWPVVSAPRPAPRGEREDTDLAQVTRALAEHAITTGVTAPHRPWRAPLPDRLEWSSIPVADAVPAHRAVVRIGLIDLPDRQAQTPLELDLTEGGTWLAVGGVRSGRSTVLRTVLGEATRALDPESLHVHVLDPGSGALASEARRLPHTGTAVGGADALRTVRLVDRLVQEVAARRAAPDVAHPNVLLLIDGMEAVSALLDEGDPGRGADQLHRLLREGAAAGVTCVVTADRAVPGGRLASVATHRLVLPLPDRADYAVAGVPPRSVPDHRPPGRGLLDEDASECQIALPRPLPETAARVRPDGPLGALRIVELPADPDIPRVAAPPDTGAPGPVSPMLLPIGPGGDEGNILSVDLARTGGLLVAGPPGSGRTAALDAFTERLRWAGVPVLRLGSGAAATDGADHDAAGTWLHAADVSGLDTWMAGLDGRPGVLVVDDLGPPAEEPAIGRLGAREVVASVALVAATGPGCLSSHYQGPVAALRRSRSGLLLCPGPGDADLMGVRLPRTPVPVRPGSGWLITAGAPERVQVARRRPRPREDAAEEGQSSSSRGPISWVANQASS